MDDRITAPKFGFSGAEHYYRTQSANQFLERIRVPTLFITAQDDPFIPIRIYDHPAFRQNPCLQLLATVHGGHPGLPRQGAPPVVAGSRHNGMDKGSWNKAPPLLVWKLNEN